MSFAGLNGDAGTNKHALVCARDIPADKTLEDYDETFSGKGTATNIVDDKSLDEHEESPASA